MADDESRGVEANRHFLGCRQPAQAKMLIVRWREDGFKFIGGCEVDGVVEARVGTDSSVEPARAAVDFAKELHLEPALAYLNGLSGYERPRKLGDSEERNGADQLDKPLGEAHK
jgi:hypothetical protein